MRCYCAVILVMVCVRGGASTDLNKLLEYSNYYYDLLYDNEEGREGRDYDEDSKEAVPETSENEDVVNYNEELMKELEEGVPVNVIPRPQTGNE